MRPGDKMAVLWVLVVISQVSCGGRSLGGDGNSVVADDGTVDSTVDADGCTVGCSGEPETVTYEPNTPIYIEVDSTHLYWSSSTGEVKKMPLAGGATTLLYDGEHGADGVALDSTHVYWSDSSAGMMMRIPKVGGVELEIAFGEPLFTSAVDLDTSHVYWIQDVMAGDSNRLLRAPLNGGVPTALFEVADSITGLAIDATHAYLVLCYTGSIVKVHLDSGATEEIVSGEVIPSMVAVDSSRAYWFGDNGSVLKSVSLAGGSPTVLAESELVDDDNSSNGTLCRLAIDATHLYWTSFGNRSGTGLYGTVSKLPLDGGSPTVLATVDGWPYDLAVSSTHVYWTSWREGGGSVLKVPK